PPKIVTNDLLKELNVRASDKLSTIVHLTLNDPVPQKGEDILNHLILSYNQAAIEDKNQMARNTLAFIEERMISLEHELNTLEKEVERYKSTKGIIDLSEQGKLYLKNVADYDRQIE